MGSLPSNPKMARSLPGILRRLSAIFCVLLLAWMTTVEVCHSHPANASAGADHCQLCMAAHSTLPVTAPTLLTPHLLFFAALLVQSVPGYAGTWRFRVSCRPPPAPLKSA